MAPITVLVHGVMGKMGREVLSALCRESDMEPVAGVDRAAGEEQLPLPDGSGHIPVSPDLASALDAHRPQVMVDFSNAEASLAACRIAAARGVNLVVGTTGHNEDSIGEIDGLAREHGIGAFLAPNFAIGAVLLMHLVKGLGRYFDYVDIVEAHHEAKIDSPSGTALALARSLRAGRDSSFTRPAPEKEPVEGTRGGDVDAAATWTLDSQHANARPDGPPRGAAGHPGADSQPSPRHHQPRVLHAGGYACHPRGGQDEGPDSGPGQAAGAVAPGPATSGSPRRCSPRSPHGLPPTRPHTLGRRPPWHLDAAGSSLTKPPANAATRPLP